MKRILNKGGLVNDVCDSVLNNNVLQCSVIFTVRNKHMTN